MSFAGLCLLLGLAGCASIEPELSLPPQAEAARIDALETAILALGRDVDAAEARRAARIAIRYSHALARRYEVEDAPIMHNLLVNFGVKQRGLCVDWTTDLLARLRQERFRSLEFHWAIANYTSLYRLEHSTVIASARGESIDHGLVLDPWRHAGRLYWSPTLADAGYRWETRAEIHTLKRLQEANLNNRQFTR